MSVSITAKIFDKNINEQLSAMFLQCGDNGYIPVSNRFAFYKTYLHEWKTKITRDTINLMLPCVRKYMSNYFVVSSRVKASEEYKRYLRTIGSNKVENFGSFINPIIWQMSKEQLLYVFGDTDDIPLTYEPYDTNKCDVFLLPEGCAAYKCCSTNDIMYYMPREFVLDALKWNPATTYPAMQTRQNAFSAAVEPLTYQDAFAILIKNSEGMNNLATLISLFNRSIDTHSEEIDAVIKYMLSNSGTLLSTLSADSNVKLHIMQAFAKLSCYAQSRALIDSVIYKLNE